MWRAIPLLKMVMRMTVYCIALAAVSLVIILAMWSRERAYWVPPHAFILDILSHGTITGLSLAIPMALVTAIFFREIRRPAFYQFTMLTVTLIITIALWVGPDLETLHGMDLFQRQYNQFILPLGVFIGNYALAVYSSRIAAGKYVREVSARLQTRLSAP